MDVNKVIFKFVSISFSILVTLLVLLGLIKLGEYCYDFGYRVFTEAPMEEEPGTDVVVLVTEDMSEYDIGGMLLENGLIRDKNLFYAQLKLSAYSGELLPGVYTLNTSMTAKEMMAVMATEPAAEPESTEETDTQEDLTEAEETEITETEETQEAQ